MCFCMNVAMGMKTVKDIVVTAEVTYLPQESNVDKQQYVFGYTMSIKNQGVQPATLMRRHWVVTGDTGVVQTVSGDGVVGECPCIEPGEEHQYTSFSMLNSPVNSMHGHYEFELDDGEMVKAEIDAFGLSVPGMVH